MRRSLGKGLSQLIAEQFEGGPTEAPVEAIVPNQRQPRKNFDDEALQELAASVREHGVIQPLIVKPAGDDRYELIAGERRLRAAKLAGLKNVPIVIRAASGADSLELALIENIQREDIGAIECALAYRQLTIEFGLTQEQVADKVGKSRAAVANTMRLLKLPESIQRGLAAGAITEGHARALLGLSSQAEQLALYKLIVERGLNVRETERLVQKQVGETKPEVTKPSPAVDPNWSALQDSLCNHFGSPVKLSPANGKKAGKLLIEFYSDDDLDRILTVLGVGE